MQELLDLRSVGQDECTEGRAEPAIGWSMTAAARVVRGEGIFAVGIQKGVDGAEEQVRDRLAGGGLGGDIEQDVIRGHDLAESLVHGRALRDRLSLRESSERPRQPLPVFALDHVSPALGGFHRLSGGSEAPRFTLRAPPKSTD